MKSKQKNLIILFVVATLASFITFIWPQKNGLSFDIDSSPKAQAAQKQEPYDLSSLQILSRVILEVKDKYVEPERIHPQKMLLSGLDAIQKSVAPVIINFDEQKEEVSIQIHNEHATFKTSDVTSPWTLTSRFQEIFEFLQKQLTEDDIEFRDLEYIAVNGMLKTLDPHSLLLSPESYEELKMSTRGHFGGLGIVVSLRDGHLTIIRPLDGTPASEAGLESGDRIVKINDESTLNMPLSEAVKRLRGVPGTTVKVWISKKQKKGKYSKPKTVKLKRAIIQIESVESKALGDGIGYLKLKSFQGNTYRDMRKALDELHQKELKGLILDLRGNPGGLLSQAIRIADTFLPSGIIVTTSSNDPKDREDTRANLPGTEDNYPLVVLVNGGSASASEIVSGALKNHNRALIIGGQTFGKGSVQTVDELVDGSAIKLTIAQYLTPGDVSIQSVGIMPDIAIDPMTVDKEDMDLAIDKNFMREEDLKEHLTSTKTKTAEKPKFITRYYLKRETRQKLRDSDPEAAEENQVEEEFLISFSKELLLNSSDANRLAMLESAKLVIEKSRNEEMAKAIADLKKLGIDWSVGEDQGPSEIAVELSTNQDQNKVLAGEPFDLIVKVTNQGSAPLYRLRATTESDYRLFDDRELIFGKLLPGESRSWSTTLGICQTEEDDKRKCTLPKSILDRADAIRVHFEEAHGHAPKSATIVTTILAKKKPHFAYTYQINDHLKGNGDGQLQVGEKAKLYLQIKNVGEGESHKAQANLRNLSGAGILLHDGRFQIEKLAPLEEETVPFSFEILSGFEDKEAKLEIIVSDGELRKSIREKISFKVQTTSTEMTAKEEKITLQAGTKIYASPSLESHTIAKIDGGNLEVPSDQLRKPFYRVFLDKNRFGWIHQKTLQKNTPEESLGDKKKSKTKNKKSALHQGKVAWMYNINPPTIELADLGDFSTREAMLKLKGKTASQNAIKDMYIYVGSRKVFYQSNPSGTKSVTFEPSLPLKPGLNPVMIVTRASKDVYSRYSFVIRRDGLDGSILETPKYEDDFLGWDIEEE